jgi:putative spermidine/putrescine transport system substrate-binding protein
MAAAALLLVASLLAPPAPRTLPAAHAAPARPFEDRYRSMSWDEIVTEARGQTVYFHMWGGSATRNTYINDFVARTVKILYNIDVKQVPVTDIVQTVNKLLGERQAGKLRDGTADLMWLNGENFRTAKEGRVMFGPWSDLLPTHKWIDWDHPSVGMDFGYPVDFYESPWGSAQFVMEYDSAKVPNPPRTMDALFEWAKANPGRFTHPAPPDFTGSVFVRHVFYWAAGGPRRLLGPFNDAVYGEVAPKTWRALNDLRPSLWRRGATFPDSSTRHLDLFAEGEVWFNMTYGPGRAANLILTGRYPRTTRTYVFDTGTIGNTNYVGIPFNAANKAGAMVLANFLISPEAQYEAAKPEVLGQVPALAIDKLPKVWQDRFAALPRHEATLPVEVLSRRKLPELQSSWLTRIERDWIANVLQR